MEYHQLEITVVNAVLVFCVLLVLFSLVKHYTERSRVPYPLWVLLFGTLCGLLITQFPGISRPIELAPPLVFYVLLPVLLFDSAMKIPSRELRHLSVPIGFFASLGVLITMGLAVAGFQLFPGVFGSIPFLDLLLLSVILSATDPVATGAIFQNFAVPERLHVLIEGESLFNDGTVVVLFALVWALMTGMGTLSISHIAGQFALSILGGLLVGYAIGTACYSLLKRWRDVEPPFVTLTLSVVMAHGTFLFAEHLLHVSGVLAVVAAGLSFGNHSLPLLSQHHRHFVRTFWDYCAFIANSLLFFVLGAEFAQHEFNLAFVSIPLIIGIFTLARAAAVYGGSQVLRFFTITLPFDWQHLLNLSGLRGALSIALILSLPVSYEHRLLFLCLAYVVIFFTLTAHVFAVAFFLKRHRSLQRDIRIG